MHNPQTDRILLLDHGYVRLVDRMGGDINVVRAARVSYDAHWRAGDDVGSDERLINSMMERKHSTPFEAVTMTFEVMAPIFVFRQWHRHRTWSYNELSARYRELPEVFYVPKPEHLTTQHPTDKQMRSMTSVGQAHDLCQIIKLHSERGFSHYRLLLEAGVARELARSVLSVNTYSHMFATVNLLNFFKFCQERCSEKAQYEIRVYAEAMLQIVKEAVAPVCCRAFERHVLKRDDTGDVTSQK